MKTIFFGRIGLGVLAAVLAGGVLASPQPELRCPEFPTPEGARVQWVAPNMRYSGVPMQIKELHTNQAPQQLLEFYKTKWRGQPPYYHEYDVGEWKAIATLRQRCFFTV